jgi:hypothetical protein
LKEGVERLRERRGRDGRRFVLLPVEAKGEWGTCFHSRRRALSFLLFSSGFFNPEREAMA